MEGVLNLLSLLGMLLPLYKSEENGVFYSLPLYELGGWQGVVFWIAPAISLFGIGSTYASALGQTLPIDRLALLLLGIVFAIVGNYLPKCRQNYTIGIKLPWTLDDTENWNKTHRLAGFLWVIGGIVFLIGAFLPGGAVLTLVTALVMVLVPTGYSYMLYRKKQKAE